MKPKNQKGSALIFALIFLLVLSVMGASMMFLAQSETWSGLNYKMMTQTRYGAEAGIHAAANYLMFSYTPPTSLALFNPHVYPVTDIVGTNIVLSSIPGTAQNYPSSSVKNAFKNATSSSSAGTTLYTGPNNTGAAVNYTVTAQLMAMAQVTPVGAPPGSKETVQTWQLTAHGDINGAKNAESEVSAVLERQVSPAFQYAAFATGAGCGALAFSGNGGTDSYDSGSLTLNANGSVNPPTFQAYGGNVGTNGNQTDSGNNVTINGYLSTPRVGVGSCSAGNVTAFTGKVNGNNNPTQVTGIIELPQAVSLPTPTIPAPGTTNISGTTTLCPTSAPTVPNVCPSGAYGDISISGGTVSLPPGTYNVNSVSISGNGSLQIVPDPVTGLYGPVIINVTGSGNSNPISLSGNGISNPTYDSTNLQFNYAGTGQINIVGNGASAAVVYAPNATASFKGNGSFYGAVIANQVTDVGNGSIHYDRKLQRTLFTVGNYVLSSFTWSKF